jgi:predicted membrane-bound mannosyltransferase
MAQRRFVVGVVACGIAFTAFQSVELNFIHYDDPAHGYVYVQTRRGFAGLVKTVDQLAARAGTGHETTIAVLSPDYWPLPWELRDYSHVAYWGKNKTVNDTIIITSSAQERLLAPTLATYQRVGSFPSRPGVDLVVFAKREALPPR